MVEQVSFEPSYLPVKLTEDEIWGLSIFDDDFVRPPSKKKQKKKCLLTSVGIVMGCFVGTIVVIVFNRYVINPCNPKTRYNVHKNNSCMNGSSVEPALWQQTVLSSHATYYKMYRGLDTFQNNFHFLNNFLFPLLIYQGIDVNTVLIVQERPQDHALISHLLDTLFAEVITIQQAQGMCFSEINVLCDPPPSPYFGIGVYNQSIIPAFVAPIRQLYNVSATPPTPGHRPRLTYVARTKSRSVKHKDSFMNSLQEQFDVTVIDSWGDHATTDGAWQAVQEHLQILANTDILMGMHGAGLGYISFLNPQAHVVELRTDFRCHLYLYQYESWMQNTTHHNIDVREYTSPPFYGYSNLVVMTKEQERGVATRVWNAYANSTRSSSGTTSHDEFCDLRSTFFNMVGWLDHSSNEVRRWASEPCYNVNM